MLYSVFWTANIEILIKSSYDVLTAKTNGLAYAEQVQYLVMERATEFMHQSTEWRMSSLQMSFPRQKDTVLFNFNDYSLPLPLQSEGTMSWD